MKTFFLFLKSFAAVAHSISHRRWLSLQKDTISFFVADGDLYGSSPKKGRHINASRQGGWTRSLIFAGCFLSAVCSSFVSSAQDLYNDSTVLELRLEFPQLNWKTLLQQNVTTETDIPVTLIVNGVRYDSVGIRYKGNSSYNVQGDKKPFNISMDAFRADQLLMGYKTLNLNNGFKDPAFVREKIAYDLAQQYLPAVRAAYVKLYINNEYWGLYLNVQQPNKQFLREWFGTAAGNFYKCDPRGELTDLGTNVAQYKTKYEKKTNEEADDWTDFIGFVRALNTLPDATFPQEIEKILDVDRTLWYLAFCNVFGSLDSYIGSGHNYYLYNNPADGRFVPVPWDLNEVLGVFRMQQTVAQTEQLPVLYNSTANNLPLLRRMLNVAAYRERYLAHIRTMTGTLLDGEYWAKRAAFFQNLIRPHLQNDTKKLYTMEQFTQNLTENVATGGGGPMGSFDIPGILSFVNNRREYLTKTTELSRTITSILTTMHQPQAPTPNDTVQVRAMLDGVGGTPYLWYSINGKPFTRKEMEFLPTGAIWVAATIPKLPAGTTVRYYVECVNSSGATNYYPTAAEHYFPPEQRYSVVVGKPPVTVVINEVLASNQAVNKDPQGQFEDWVELFNTSNNEVPLGGMYLSDDPTRPTKWRIPDGTTIAGDGYLLIWADEDTTDTPGIHAGFKISKSGESVWLSDIDATGNTLLDSVSFGAQEDDKTWGRLPNGTGTFKVLSPTPAAENHDAVGVEEAGELPLFWSIFPQPTTNTLTAAVTLASDATGIVTLSDASGKEFFHIVAQLFIGRNEVHIPAANLSVGLYTVRLQLPEKAFSAQVLVLR